MQFYVYPKNALRLQTKEDVALYVNERKISNFDTSGECDTRSQDNVRLWLELHTRRTHHILGIRLSNFFQFTILVHFQLLAIVDFYPSGLPEGWVRELVFRKTKEGLIRRDPVNNKAHI